MELVPGAKAPDFTLPCDGRGRVSPADFKGRKLVLCPVDAQDAFKAKHGLTIPLASDETHRMLEAYGVWGEKSMYGRTFMGVLRATFLIDADGRIARSWPKVKVEGHAEDVLQAAKSL
jgi:peroxiredoxin Q/BCP